VPQNTGPFTLDDLKAIQGHLERLDEADRLIETSKRAGLDMADQEKRSRELRAKAMQFKQAFWPGQ
jgi:hypothetical protein